MVVKDSITKWGSFGLDTLATDWQLQPGSLGSNFMLEITKASNEANNKVPEMSVR